MHVERSQKQNDKQQPKGIFSPQNISTPSFATALSLYESGCPLHE
ncbi:hypothetical protein C2W64_01548 [Brevibacillus laterosporus]|nr:hypothetical protein C2W64_01548 [Brevibacillus laterosporus]